MSTQQNAAANTSASQAAASLALLLQEDPLITKHGLHVSGRAEEHAFSYAADLLKEEEMGADQQQQQAENALGEVERKLALVGSLAERVSRTSPEAVAGPLLKMHGFAAVEEDAAGDDATPEGGTSASSSSANTLSVLREKCDRLKRQGDVLDGVAQRVETSLQRGMKRMDTSTKRLSRVLDLSAALKMIMRLQFESSKLQGYYLDDLRDLTRAAGSVAVIEDLLAKPELNATPPIDIVESIRPQVKRTATAVRKSASTLLERYHSQSATRTASVVQLGATLQVYFHLGELPQATWSAVEHALRAGEKASHDFLSPTTLSHLTETANTEAKLSAAANRGGAGKKPSEADLQRALKNKLRELRADASSKWAQGVSQAAMQVWNLHQVLCKKSDPVSRQVYVDVVATSAIPEKFRSSNEAHTAGSGDFSIFAYFWESLCRSIGERLKHILEYDSKKFAPDVAALYPAVRSAVIKMLGSLNEAMQAGLGTLNLEDATASTPTVGSLGGSAALNDSFLQWGAAGESAASSGLGATSADTWTVASKAAGQAQSAGQNGDSNSASLSVIFQSSEWKTLLGDEESCSGLFRLQEAFLIACSGRLCAPLQYMFTENVAVDQDGHTISALPLLPSRYDIQKFESNIQQELSLADPREGGGDLSSVTMIAEMVVAMVAQFCDQARNAVSNAGEDGCLDPNDGSATSALKHDVKVVSIMNAMAEALRNAPEKVFLVPYRPTVTPRLEEAAEMCEKALQGGLLEIDRFVDSLILAPLCKALNRRIASSIARIHLGSYLQAAASAYDPDGESSSFVEKHLSASYEQMSSKLIARIPGEYGSKVAATVAKFSIYAFVSNVALIRPITEPARMHITQDLTDFEFALQQFVTNCSGSGSSEATSMLNQMDNGKPYSELRAARQMLYWTALNDESKGAGPIAKAMLREGWVKDVRPSTACHYLFSYGPSLLSSPHHMKRMRVEDYVLTLVDLNGSVEDGEASAWMTTMACCDSYRQRQSAMQQHGSSASSDGDSRIPSILLTLGPELLRRRRA